MPILNLNGVERKNGIADGKTLRIRLFGAQVAARQHPTVTFAGKTYNSPFTESAKSIFPTGRTISTQPHIAAAKVESPGTVVPLFDFVKVHPWEKGTFFSTKKPARPIVGRVGGPSKNANTPANPNAPQPMKQARPTRSPAKGKNETLTNLSFLRSGGTLGGHVDPQAGTSSNTSRWHVTKKGAVE